MAVTSRRPFAPAAPAQAPRRVFGVGWALPYLAFTAGAAVLWTGIGEAQVGQLQASLGPNTKFLWLAGLFVAAILVPALLPKGAAKVRGFQLWSLALMTAALGSAIFLRRDALPDTAKAGTRAAIGLFAGAAIDDPRAVLATLLTGENYQLDLVAAVPPGYSDALTRASAKATAAALLERHSTYVGLVLAANALVPDQVKKLEPLKAKLDALKARLPSLGEREGLDEVLALQAEVTGALLVAAGDDAPAKAKAAAAKATQAAANAACEPRGEVQHCRLNGVVYVFERENGRWRVNRPAGNDGLFALPFLPILGLHGAPTGANPKGDDLAKALATVEALTRAGIRISLKRSVDPELDRVLTDDAALVVTERFDALMAVAFGKTPADQQRFFDLLTADLTADGLLPAKDATAEERDAIAKKRDGLHACQPRAELKRSLARWNRLVAASPADAQENDTVNALVNLFKLERASPTEFTGGPPVRLVLRDGVWKWWEPRNDRNECPTGPPADRPKPAP